MRIIKPTWILCVAASAALAETGGLQSLPGDVFHHNVLQNPSFASGTEAWDRSNGAYVTLQTDGGRTGANYIRIGGSGALSSQYIQQRPFAYHRRFRLSFWYKTAGANPGLNARVTASRMDFTHGSYLYVADRTGNNAATGGCGACLPKDGTLKYISVVSNLATV
ncbi:MAG: hypothetical protein L0Z53_21155, partial [Acidobacteriales bacterium]|nr:hypothetical protein [Terriglobales bacterium]